MEEALGEDVRSRDSHAPDHADRLQAMIPPVVLLPQQVVDLVVEVRARVVARVVHHQPRVHAHGLHLLLREATALSLL